MDKIQFSIAGVEAEVNGTVYPVTALSNTFVVSVANPQVNQTLSGRVGRLQSDAGADTGN